MAGHQQIQENQIRAGACDPECPSPPPDSSTARAGQRTRRPARQAAPSRPHRHRGRPGRHHVHGPADDLRQPRQDRGTGRHGTSGRVAPGPIERIVAAYEKVRDNLELHEPGFPTEEYLRERISQGIPVEDAERGRGQGLTWLRAADSRRGS
ncbi:MAG TPA: nucleoside hydrolase-like domain-containing protein [Vicinamibacteria bacterium]|nr:nucleoside hydrolase-like domain-containing protein [Vicinamibacteria bacterium]